MSFPLVGRDAAAARQAERFFDAADVAESGRAACGRAELRALKEAAH